jgi:membrane-bound lytic murein transglycosylase
MSALPTRLETLAISLPMFHSMTAQDVGDAIRKVLTYYEGKGERSHLLESRQSK